MILRPNHNADKDLALFKTKYIQVLKNKSKQQLADTFTKTWRNQLVNIFEICWWDGDQAAAWEGV